MYQSKQIVMIGCILLTKTKHSDYLFLTDTF